MKLAFIGIGKVGFALANHFQQKGHEIIVAHDDVDGESVASARQKNPAFTALPLQPAIDEADLVFLAIPFPSSEEILKPLSFRGKVLVDCTNPVGPGISHGLHSTVSGSEKIQEWAGDARLVKAFSIYGYENLVNPHFPDYEVKPVMPIAGNEPEAKQTVQELSAELGFTALDVGELSRALHLEHMTLLWVNMVRADGRSPHFTWACLAR